MLAVAFFILPSIAPRTNTESVGVRSERGILVERDKFTCSAKHRLSSHVAEG